jgi:hypothetical protein
LASPVVRATSVTPVESDRPARARSTAKVRSMV